MAGQRRKSAAKSSEQSRRKPKPAAAPSRQVDRVALARILRSAEQDPEDRSEEFEAIADECDSLLVTYLDAEAYDSTLPNREDRKRRLDRFLRALAELNAAASDAAFMLGSLPEFESLRASAINLHCALNPNEEGKSALADGPIIEALRRTERRADAAIHREWLILGLANVYTRVTQRRAGRVVDAYATSEADRYGGQFLDLIRLFLPNLSDGAISQAIKRANIPNR